MPADFFRSRKLRYEIYMMVDGRWRLESVVDDDRESLGRPYGQLDFEETERLIQGRANSLIAGGKVQAVRVVRERMRRDGFSTSKEIYYREAAASRNETATVGVFEGEMPLCTTPEDLYHRRSCKVVSALFRSFLDKLFISPIELMHNFAYLRRLEDNHTLLRSAVHQVAAKQCRTTGEDAQTRGAELHRLVHGVMARARGLSNMRDVGLIEPGRFQAFLDKISTRFGSTDMRTHAYVGITRHMQGAGGYLAKLDITLEWMREDLSPEARAIADEFVAGLLDSPQLVMDLLGRQRNLAAALVALDELSYGQYVPRVGQGNSSVLGLGAQIATGRLPLASDAIWDRILRELERGRPLALNDPTQEWATLMTLSDRLLADVPPSHAEAVSAALKVRVDRLRAAD